MPAILTCLIGRQLGSSTDPLAHYPLRNLAAALLGSVCKKYSKSSHTLRPRLARTCLKHMLDPAKPLGVNYGGIIGLHATGGPEVVRVLIVPNLKEYEVLITDAMEESETKRKEAGMVLGALVRSLQSLEDDTVVSSNGFANGSEEVMRTKLREKVGPLVAEKVWEMGRPKMVKAILES